MDTPDTFPSMFFGYAVIWGLIVLFCISLGMRQRKLSKSLSQLDNQGK